MPFVVILDNDAIDDEPVIAVLGTGGTWLPLWTTTQPDSVRVFADERDAWGHAKKLGARVLRADTVGLEA
jgi:hypothetical protein